MLADDCDPFGFGRLIQRQQFRRSRRQGIRADLALAEDRAVGEWIRHHLALIVYGRLAGKEAAKRSEELRK